MTEIQDTHSKTTLTKRAGARGCFVCLAVVLLAMPGLSHADEKATTTPTNMSLWQAIDTLSQQIPFSKQKVETALATPLSEVDNNSNKLFRFFKSPPIRLAEGIVISNVDLRIKREGSHPGFLVLEMDGACLTLEQIRERYSELQITQLPRGRSLEEETSHSQLLPWGKLSFGFKEKNPKCLASIAFEPKK
ncbi:MAG: hypothetical protein FWD46_00585 [Cystobacterineae bacterium]|nr:hypothetical protein [Cystobacterineae bacterium]